MATGVESYFDLTGNYGANVRIHYRETYDVATNASTVAITGIQVMSTWYAGVTYYLDGSVAISGSTAFSMSSSAGSNPVTISAMNQYYSAGGSFGSVSGIVHNDNGAKSITITATVRGYTRDGDAGSGWTASGSTNVALTTIPRKSTMSAPNGTLGVAQDLSVSRKASSFTHTITYKCGSVTGTVCAQSADDTPTWTPPVALAAQNTKGATVKIDFTITTYSGSTAVGSNTASATYTIPNSIAPKCSVVVSDYTGLDAEYGAMVKGYSRLRVKVSTEISYGSEISAYEVKINGVTYNSPSFVTDAINAAGDVTIAVKVTDGRGRSATTETTVTILDYTQPAITLLKVKRCNVDGSNNDSGEYTQVTFSSRVTPLNDKNSATYKLAYKKYADATYTEVYFQDLTDDYAVSEFSAILPADSSSSYNVRVTVVDDFTSHARATVVSTGATIMHWAANGRGMGIGKMSEADDTLDMGWHIRMNGHSITGLPSFVNLLDNSDFTNPVNQRAFVSGNSIAGWAFFLDRWAAWDVAATPILDNNGITCSKGIYQPVYALKKYVGKKITCAVGFADGNVMCSVGTVTNDGGWASTAYNTNGVTTIILYNAAVDMWTFVIQGAKNVIWAAVYEGEYTATTLPDYVPKGYGVELIECMRYYQKLGGCFVPLLNNANTIGSYIYMLTVNYPIAMRTVPTITLGDSSDGSYKKPSVIAYANNCLLHYNSSSTGEIVQCSSIELSAD